MGGGGGRVVGDGVGTVVWGIGGGVKDGVGRSPGVGNESVPANNYFYDLWQLFKLDKCDLM